MFGGAAVALTAHLEHIALWHGLVSGHNSGRTSGPSSVMVKSHPYERTWLYVRVSLAKIVVSKFSSDLAFSRRFQSRA